MASGRTARWAFSIALAKLNLLQKTRTEKRRWSSARLGSGPSTRHLTPLAILKLKTRSQHAEAPAGKTLQRFPQGPAAPHPTYINCAVPSDCLIQRFRWHLSFLGRWTRFLPEAVCDQEKQNLQWTTFIVRRSAMEFILLWIWNFHLCALAQATICAGGRLIFPLGAKRAKPREHSKIFRLFFEI